MKVRTDRCPTCGEDPHGDAPCPSRPEAAVGAFATAPCRCLPEAPDGWRACASCGLAQAPGKESCGFCGHRWRTDEAG